MVYKVFSSKQKRIIMNLKRLVVYACIWLVSACFTYYFIDRSIGRFLIDDVCVELCRMTSDSVMVIYGVPIVLCLIIFVILATVYDMCRVVLLGGKKSSVNST